MEDKNRKYSNQVFDSQSSLKGSHSKWLNYALLAGILTVTFWCYHYTLKNQFTNWDDNIYVSENPFIKNLSANWKTILSKNIIPGYYHPVTMLSIALNWYFSGASPMPYYSVNIILHLFNTALVFFLSLTLFKIMVKKGYFINQHSTFNLQHHIEYLAGFCALWHGIHPMHVESVSWLSERKDVLYLFFYLLGFLAYLKYITLTDDRRPVKAEYKFNWYYLLVILMYLLSLLSKPLAVAFPLSLFAIDVLLKRNMQWKLLVEKIPFLLISLFFGYITYRLQDESAIVSLNPFTLMQRISIAGYNYLMYLVKFLAPFHLCSFYLYPDLTKAGNLPSYIYLAALAAFVLTAGIFYFAYKKGDNYFRIVFFGLGFYFFNIMIVLQFFPDSQAIMADRYTYAPYLGITFMVIYLLAILYQHFNKSLRYLLLIIVCAFSFTLALLCHARTEVWHNTKTLWEDVIKQYPHKISKAYDYLSGYYFEQYKTTHADNDINQAYENSLEAIKLNPVPSAYCNMGNIFCAKGQFEQALYYYGLALKLDSANLVVYVDRAIAYSLIGKFDLAIQDYRSSLRLKPYSEMVFGNMGLTWLNDKQFDSAIVYYNRAIQINPNNPVCFRFRGIAEFEKGDIKSAINDFIQTLRMNPNDAECMFYLSQAYYRIGDMNNASKYAQMAHEAGYRPGR